MIRLLLAAALLAPAAAHAAAPAKAYVIAEMDVSDPEAFKTYAVQTTPILAKYGGHYIARAGRTIPLEGAPPAGRVAVLEFPSLERAEAFQNSAEYRKIAAIRHRAAKSRSFIVEGVAP